MALDELARRRGVSRAEAARQAITETAAEAATLMADPDYVTEARDLTQFMEQSCGSR